MNTSPATTQPPGGSANHNRVVALIRLLDAPWIDQTRLDRPFTARRAADQLGTRVYTALACLFLFGISGPTVVSELAGAPLAVCFLIHLKRTFKIWSLAFVDPRLYVIMALFAWMAVTLLWSSDTSQGFEELGALRWAWAIILLYPVLDRRKLLLTAYVLGLLAGSAGQFIQLLQGPLDVVIFERAPGRISGWWDPVVGASVLCAALGMHLPPAIMGSGRVRLLGALGALITFAGIIATGSRGAWIAAAMLMGVVSLVAILRVRPRKRALVPAAIVAAVLAVVLGASAWAMKDSPLVSRISTGYREVTSAISSGEFRSDTGARIYMNIRAVQAFASHPVQGVGAGGYQSWVNAYDPEHNDIAHPHAHSAYLHAAATLGIVGLFPMCLLVVTTFRSGIRAHEGLGTYSIGPVFALLGLLFAGLFDTVQINAHSAAQLAVLIALCPPVLPKQLLPKRAKTQS